MQVHVRSRGVICRGRSIQSVRPISRACRSVIITARASNGMKGMQLVGVGSCAPSTVVTNDDLAKLVDTNDEWIASRTGIHNRHVLAKGETLSSLAKVASEQALEMAGIRADEIDLILFATSSPDDLFGGAGQLQALIGAKNAVGFDITAACSGFVLALVTASQFIRAGTSKRVLVVGADALSRFVDWRDRSTCILFGDGCGAVVVQATDGPCGLLGLDMHSDGNGQKSLNCMFAGEGMKPTQDKGASDQGSYKNVAMVGQDVYRFAVRSVPQVIENALVNAGLQKEDVDWLVMHQANQRIIDAAAERIGLAPDRVVSNLKEYGNTSAASIPLALDGAVRNGSIKKGDVIAMAGFGAGLTWASVIVKWG